MEKIIFVTLDYPENINEYLMLPSLDFALMSSIVKENGYDCELIDMRINHYNMKDLEEILLSVGEKNHIKLLCIESECSTHCNAIKAIKVCRKVLGNYVPIALRGEITTFLPIETLQRNAELNFALVGESEGSIEDILSWIAGARNLEDIRNIAYRDNAGKIIKSKNILDKKDLSLLPMPDRGIYDIKKYLKRDSETIVRSSRGCPGNCAFCIKTKMSSFRVFPIDRFCDELEELQNLGFESFFFSDDTFAFSDKRVEEFYNEVKKRNLKIRWTSNIRIKDINEYKIKRMKEIGAYRVFVGIETVNANTQNLVNKNLEIHEILDKIKILHKYNMEFHASFILGAPGDAEDDMFETAKFLKKIKPTLVTFNQLKLFPGTDLYNKPEKYNILPFDKFWFEKDDWAYYPSFGTIEMPPQKINEWSARLYKEFFLTPNV